MGNAENHRCTGCCESVTTEYSVPNKTFSILFKTQGALRERAQKYWKSRKIKRSSINTLSPQEDKAVAITK